MWIFQTNPGYVVGGAKDMMVSPEQARFNAKMADVRGRIAEAIGEARSFRSQIAAIKNEASNESWKGHLKQLDKNIRPKIENVCDRIEAAAKKAKTLPELEALLHDLIPPVNYVNSKTWGLNIDAPDNKVNYTHFNGKWMPLLQNVFDKYTPKEREGFMK